MKRALTWLLEFLRTLLSKVLNLPRWLTDRVLKMLRWLEAGSAFSKTLTLVVSLVVIALAIASVAFGLRWAAPRSQLTVSAFQIFDVSGKTASPDGKVLADMFVDELHRVLEKADSFSGTYGSSRKNYGPVPDLPQIPVATSFGIEVKGVSLDTIISTYNRIRYREFVISGDLIHDVNGKSTIKVRYEVFGDAKNYERSFVAEGLADLENALSELALDLVKDISPQTAARYLLANAVRCSSPGECDVRWSEAIQYCLRWTQTQPANYLAFYYLGYSLEGTGRHADALIYLTDAQQLNGNSDLAWITQGKALLESGRLNEAEAAFRKALRIRRTPNANVDLGIIARRIGRAETAEWFYRQALKEDPNDVSALLNLGDVLIELHRYPDANLAFTRMLSIDPTDGPAVVGLARSLAKEGRSEEAIRQCEAAARLDGTSAAPYIAEGVVLLEMGRTRDAVEKFRAPPARGDTLAGAMFGIAMENQGYLDDAAEDFRVLVDQLPDPGSAHADAAMLHLLRARVLAEKGDRASAEAEDAEAQELVPGARYIYWETELLRNRESQNSPVR
ncbi:MAG TPA: tetratricopeptide repeat protein [Terracidiphilus sp.]|jgi:tetratricopeptide (TPR) repeat protein|nr:tetratricopeptide repeat protein [Terracidiphilus sp.]